MPTQPDTWTCPQCHTLVDTSTLGLFAELQCPSCGHQERVHTHLGNYALERVLGIGGMSVVYRAMDVALHRPLAIKVLNESFRDQPERIERFENECAMMARVRHENVTSVYSAGHAYGQFYIAMELVEGKNLEHLVSAKHTMKPLRALEIIYQVAEGLQAAAEAGLLHRDMKPGNILITPEGQAKVIDFGLAVDSQEGDTEEILWATPYYVPPETLERKPEDVRADIYALGMTLRYLLTGKEKFDGRTDSISALIKCKRKMPSISWQCPNLPPALCRLVDHMTCYRVSHRPANYHELLQEIEETIHALQEASQLVQINPDKPRRRSRRKLYIAGAWAASAALGGLMFWLMQPPKPEPTQAFLPLQKAPSIPSDAPRLRLALSYLRQYKYSHAVSFLLELAESTDDPAAGVWYAHVARSLLATCVVDANSSTRATELLLKRLEQAQKTKHPEQEEQCLAAIAEQLSAPMAPPALAQVWNPLFPADLRKQADQLSGSTLPTPLQATLWLHLAEQAYWAGATPLRKRCLEQIANLSLPAEYQELRKVLAEPADDRARTITELVPATARAAALMRRHQFTDARKVLATFPLSHVQARVQAEVCTVAQAFTDALRRKLPQGYKEGCPCAELSATAAKVGAMLNQPALEHDALVLGLLLEGKHEQAFAKASELAKEHKLSPAFAIIAQSWQRRWETAQ